MAETAVLGVGRNEIPPYYTELSKSTVQVLLTSAMKIKIHTRAKLLSSRPILIWQTSRGRQWGAIAVPLREHLMGKDML